MHVILMGRAWKLERLHQMKHWGLCDPPHRPYKKIMISTRAKAKVELDTIIHECIHAGFFDLAEDTVNEVSICVSTVLWDLGYRKRKTPVPAKVKNDLQDVCRAHFRLHFPFFKEDVILEFADDMGLILYRLGYRKWKKT